MGRVKVLVDIKIGYGENGHAEHPVLDAFRYHARHAEHAQGREPPGRGRIMPSSRPFGRYAERCRPRGADAARRRPRSRIVFRHGSGDEVRAREESGDAGHGHRDRNIDTAKSVYRIHSDRASELTGDRVHNYVKPNGIRATQTAGHAPNANPRAEGAINIIKPKARAMLASLGDHGRGLWPLAVQHACWALRAGRADKSAGPALQ